MSAKYFLAIGSRVRNYDVLYVDIEVFQTQLVLFEYVSRRFAKLTASVRQIDKYKTLSNAHNV